jgi:peptidoglycan-N-acetylglucosamine deacetylase
MAVNRRGLLVSAGLVAAGGGIGAGAVAVGGSPDGRAAAPALPPAARTATPAGTGEYSVAVTFRTAPAARIVALTFDDGPTAEWTPRVLAMLDRHGAAATFFRVGERAAAARGLVARTVAAGHEQGNHTWQHDDLTQHNEAFDETTLRRTHELLAELTGRPPVLCRPPYGRIDSVGLAACATLHYDVVLWSGHVTGATPASDVDTIVRTVTPGSVILAHDGGTEPNAALMAQLDRLIGALSDDGYQFVTFSDLLVTR